MPVKVFISYSHKDEKYKDDLLAHMASLKRAEIVSDWNDRDIDTGQEWRKEISENLESSELIIFLISSDFMSSDYCMNIEAKTALDMHQAGKAQLIPIVIRPVEWSDSELSKLQALPKDALAVSSWSDPDQAWVNVIQGIKSLINRFQPKKIIANKGQFEQTPSLIEWLDDTELVLTHRRVNRVLLSDIFVLPDIEVIDEETDEFDIESSSLLLSESGYYLVSGDDQQGKTTLLKHLYQTFLKKSYLVAYFDASEIKTSKLEDLLGKALKKQYEDVSVSSFLDYPDKVLLIDNFDLIGLNTKYQERFLREVHEQFEYVVITCNTSFDLVSSELETLAEYTLCRLQGLGHMKREELARKWIALGIEESIEATELYSECDALEVRLSAAIRKNIVPPKPVNVLMLIQVFEAYHKQNITLTSYGHCYQELIYQSLNTVKIPKQEYDKYFNFMTELSWAIYVNKEGLNQYQQEQFFSDYQSIYLSIDGALIVKNLLNSRILEKKDNRIRFKYSYIHYFFVGKKIAESYSSNPDVITQVDYLLENLHREDFANILIFITHHSKETWLINKIMQVMADLFKDEKATSLDKGELKFIEDFIRSIPELIVEQREIQDERDKHNKRLDEIDRQMNSDDEEPLDILATINKTLKGIEISGQIIRNRHASLTRKDIHQLAESGIETGLRFLDYFIRISDSAKKEIVEFIRDKVDETPKGADIEITQKAEFIFLQMTYGAINAIVRKIASSIGSKDAREIFEELEELKSTPAYTLVNQAIELQYTRSLNMSTLDKTLEKIHDNPVCLRILKEMVVQHIYMFPVGYKEKQQLSNKLGFSIKQQRLMDKKTRGKG